MGYRLMAFIVGSIASLCNSPCWNCIFGRRIRRGSTVAEPSRARRRIASQKFVPGPVETSKRRRASWNETTNETGGSP
jgi:hypothetical protein